MNCDDVIKNIEDMVEKKIPLSPSWWIEQAQKLVVLSGDETDKLYLLQGKIASAKVGFIDDGKSVAEAKLRTEQTKEYAEMQSQKSKVERITEIIRIAKIQSRMREGEFGGSNL